MKKSGYLMPVASLPSDYGIGDFGPRAYEFIDIMVESGLSIWQILPLNPLGYGNSPYQPYSSLAGDDIYISLDKLIEMNLLSSEDIMKIEFNQNIIEYDNARINKNKYLKISFENFKKSNLGDDFKNYLDKNEWVYKYAVFLTLKKHNNFKCWIEWPEEEKNWIKDMKFDLKPFEDEIAYEMYLQYIFYTQWINLRRYANQKGIQVMGDIPIYVGIDSLDVWDNQECFILDQDGNPTFVAGVPPDYFSETGQRWGNPIYDWEYIKRNNFDFWIERLKGNIDLFDIIRIDHFRAFDTYWKIPSSCDTAIEGEWVEAPGFDMFDALFKAVPNANIVVEDLGDLRPEVHTLRDHYNFKGMKIIQFTFDPNETNNDFVDRENMIIYTGTHDNQTIKGWFNSQSDDIQNQTTKFLKQKGFTGNIEDAMIEYCFSNIANMAIVPVQDVIGLDDTGRLNTPGTVGSPNWEWKLDNFKILNIKKDFINALNMKYRN